MAETQARSRGSANCPFSGSDARTSSGRIVSFPSHGVDSRLRQGLSPQSQLRPDLRKPDRAGNLHAGAGPIGGWDAQGRMTPNLNDTKCQNNPADGVSSIPLSSLSGSRAGSGQMAPAAPPPS